MRTKKRKRARARFRRSNEQAVARKHAMQLKVWREGSREAIRLQVKAEDQARQVISDLRNYEQLMDKAILPRITAKMLERLDLSGIEVQAEYRHGTETMNIHECWLLLADHCKQLRNLLPDRGGSIREGDAGAFKIAVFEAIDRQMINRGEMPQASRIMERAVRLLGERIANGIMFRMLEGMAKE